MIKKQKSLFQIKPKNITTILLTVILTILNGVVFAETDAKKNHQLNHIIKKSSNNLSYKLAIRNNNPPVLIPLLKAELKPGFIYDKYNLNYFRSLPCVNRANIYSFMSFAKDNPPPKPLVYGYSNFFDKFKLKLKPSDCIDSIYYPVKKFDDDSYDVVSTKMTGNFTSDIEIIDKLTQKVYQDQLDFLILDVVRFNIIHLSEMHISLFLSKNGSKD